MCRDDVRVPLRQLLKPSLPDVAVLGYNELLPATRIDGTGTHRRWWVAHNAGESPFLVSEYCHEFFCFEAKESDVTLDG